MLGDLTVPHDDRVLVDFRTSDDAGVYKLDDHRALVQTVDFFTPVVDDPIAYGRIAAANALSDVYAMGGRPLTALAIAAFPKDADRSVLSSIFRGGLLTLREAGVALLGGHTVQDEEIKFGYAITGDVDPDRIWSNAGARAGDALILTKPLGTGVVATAIKFERAPRAVAEAAIASMSALNRDAAAVLAGLPPADIHACTDITGFGLIGHGTEMASASGGVLAIDVDAVPDPARRSRSRRPEHARRRAHESRSFRRRSRGGSRTRSAARAAALRSPDVGRAAGRSGAGPPVRRARAHVGGRHWRPSHRRRRGRQKRPKGCRNAALNGINLRLACSRICPSSGSFSSFWC